MENNIEVIANDEFQPLGQTESILPAGQTKPAVIAAAETNVFSSWKEVAAYLAKGVRTVQRWEREYGLPVRRAAHSGRKAAVLARRREIDAWLDSRPCRSTIGLPAEEELEQLRRLLAESRAEVLALKAQLAALHPADASFAGATCVHVDSKIAPSVVADQIASC